jgi:hypothetical protein
METEFNRRNFIKMSTVAGITGCAFLLAGRFNSLKAFDSLSTENEIPDPKKLNYCGYQCPADCQFLQATCENNPELKLKAYETWKIKEKYGVEFDAEKIFCWGCKTKDKPQGIVLSKCTIRNCAIEKGFDSCIECNNLDQCEFELWKKFTDFHKQVLEMQKTYMGTK